MRSMGTRILSLPSLIFDLITEGSKRRFPLWYALRPTLSHLRHLMFRTTLVLTSIMFLIVLSAPRSVSQNVDAGQMLFNNSCRTCHSVKEGDNRLGPSLYKVLGRKAGSLPNYGYSSAMRSADFVWDKGKLDRYIANPDAVVPGNNMKPFAGLASADARAKVIAFLESLTTGQ
jgi:cytochrome c